MTRVIVVEDEDLTRRAIAAALREAGFNVVEAADAFACRAALQQHSADAVVLDLGLPGINGMALAAELRTRADMGLIVVSRRAEHESRIEALELGVDDYMVKPIHFGELTARLRSVLRRRDAARGRLVRVGRWTVDLDSRDVQDGERSAALTRGEFDLLARLIDAVGKIVSREELLRSISRNPHETDLRSVDALVSRLRRKLGDASDESRLILTAPGFGYRLALSPQAQ
jgi:DNA-binding response OmpR family regulator